MRRDYGPTDELGLTFLIEPEDSEWVGICLALDIAADAETKEKVIEVLKDLVGLYITDCVETEEIPIPLRPVPPDALREFLAPAGEASEASFIAHPESVPIRAAV